MSVVDRLEKGLEFLKANAWGQGADRQEVAGTLPEAFAYCARGALIYGAFGDTTENVWCPDRADWHKGLCVDGADVCENRDEISFGEYSEAMEALDDGATVVGGRWMISVEYNDAIDRTKDDIIRMFEAAITKAREKDE